MKQTTIGTLLRASQGILAAALLGWTLFGAAAVHANAGQELPVAQASGMFEPAPCMFTMPANWVEGQDVSCGYLTVPEQYSAPQGPKIKLAVAIIKSHAPDRQPDPLVMLQGGPGGSTIDTYTQIIPTRKLLPGNRDIVLFDQRGTLYSEPALTCPEFFDLTIKTLDQDLSDEEGLRLSLDAVKKCRDRLAGEGVNLSAYDSLENAADIETLRNALGYEQINLYGVSYGTLLALHAMRQYPNGLRSVILDSVVPPQTNFILAAPHTENRAFEALFTACKEDRRCDKAYPNLREEFYALAGRLDDDPVTVELMDFETGERHDALVDGAGFISLTFQMMYNSDLIPLIPRLIYDARGGNWDFLARILSFVVFDRTMSEGMYYSTMCAEDADFTLDQYDLSGLPEQLVKVEENSAEQMLDTCKLWDVKPLGAEVDDPVVSAIPTLLLTGEFDPITPPDYAREAAQGLKNSFLFVFGAGGHGEVGSFDCADQMLLDFLDNPQQAPDSSCLAEVSKVEFSTSANLVRLPVLIKMLNLEGGTGWQALLYLAGLLFVLGALLVYPLVGLVRLVRQKPAQPAPVYAGGWSSAPAPRPAGKPFLYRLGPWLAVLAAGSLLLFTAIFIAVVVSLVMNNDFRSLLGLPGAARILFGLPPLAAGLLILTLLGGLAGWLSKAGSAWGKLYLTLFSLAGLVCVAVLAMWGMLTAILN